MQSRLDLLNSKAYSATLIENNDIDYDHAEYNDEYIANTIYEIFDSPDIMDVIRALDVFGVTDINQYPNTKQIFYDNKIDLIKNLLRQFKDYSEDDYAFELKNLNANIQKLKDVGIDWSELGVIQKSIPYKLDENNTPAPTRFDDTIKGLLQTGYIDVYVRRLQDAGLRDAEIIKLLTPYSTDIVNRIMDKQYRPILPGYVVYELLLLLGTGAKWPELLSAIADNKDSVIKYFLNKFKEFSDDDIELEILNTDINNLQQSNINWPELTIIKKSIERDLSSRNLLEAHPVIPQKLIKIFTRRLNDIYERGIGQLAYLIIEMKNAGATDQEIASLLSEKRQEIVKILRNTIHNESPKNWRATNEFAVAISSLIDIGLKWPPLLELLNYYRDKIDAWAIAAIFDAGFGKHVAETLRKFKQLGFDILPIRRSIKATILPTLTEYLATHGIDHYTVAKLESMHRLKLLPRSLDDKTTKLVFDAIDKSMSNGMPNDFKNALKYLAAMNIPNLEPTVKSIVEANKTPIIKALLTAMKTGLGNAHNYYVLPTYYIVDTLQLLHKLGIQWPEIAAITRSLKAGR